MLPETPQPRVLVVDDNADNRALARATLEDEGYAVILADGGEAGIAAYEREQPDCILLDVRMPGVDGFAVCNRIRALPGGAHVPILFLTALRDVDTFDEALRAGGDDFLTKPVRPTELVLRVAAALKLRRMNDELREHYDLVRRQRDDLMRLQLQKERLIAFVVHDLKNPVGAMDLHAQVVLRDRDLSPRAAASVHFIRDEARSLLRMVHNLLDISKSEEGRLAPQAEPVDLAAIASEVLGALALRARTVEVTLEPRLEVPTLRGDRELLRRVIENLVENAIRFAPPGTAVTLASLPRDGAVELRVADAGPGVPAAMRDRVFERFVQVEGGGSQRGARPGHGLGLAFCKLAVEAHGGRIWVEDASPGAVFCVRLPDAG